MRAPDYEGPAGRAWALDSRGSSVPDHAASLGGWLIHAPGSHPIWTWKTLAVIHLRDIPGCKPAHRKYPEAAYELMILSIDPERCPAPDPDKVNDGYRYLTPADVVEQFHGVDDATAREIGRLSVGCIVRGLLVPDEDYRSVWAVSIATTVKHFVDGKHERPA